MSSAINSTLVPRLESRKGRPEIAQDAVLGRLGAIGRVPKGRLKPCLIVTYVVWFMWSLRPQSGDLVSGTKCSSGSMRISAVSREKMEFLWWRLWGTVDHVHLLISLPRTISIAKAVQLLKSGSSKWIHENFPGSQRFAWQEGYGAFSVGVSQRATTVRYIQAQAEHHKRISFGDELKKFLAVHGMVE
jgi:hypothetical protein